MRFHCVPLVHAQLILHCGPVSVAAGAASGEALRVAQDLLASAPPLNIVASTSLVARLTAAGMSHPLHALPTNAEEVLWVVEVGSASRANRGWLVGVGVSWHDAKPGDVVDLTQFANFEA
eukprot:969893-Pelagomonas_calceolata.AAC.1